jgi:adenosine kinase
MATVGQDFGEYRAWLDDRGIDTSAIVEIESEFTSSFFVNTDQENNQIASFYMGAMGWADRLSFHDLQGEVEVAIISPNAPAAMNKYVRECQEMGIPYLYDPSQQIIWLTADDLLAGARGAYVLIVNEYEFGMIQNKTGLSEADLLALPQVTIVTRGEEGSTIYAPEQTLSIPAVPPRPLVEPTGVGDGYRGGIIKGLLKGLPWQTTGRIASLAAAYVLEQEGTQNHAYSLADFVERYRRTFDDDLSVEDLTS